MLPLLGSAGIALDDEESLKARLGQKPSGFIKRGRFIKDKALSLKPSILEPWEIFWETLGQHDDKGYEVAKRDK